MLVTGTPARAETGFLDRAVTIAGETYRYQVYVPLEWTGQRTWPVVLYLHGADPRGSDGTSHLNGALPNAIRADRARFPAVLVLPQARDKMSWGTPAMQTMAIAALDAAVHEFNGDAERVYLTGFSMGGAGVLRVAARWPGRFAALVDVSGPATLGGITSTRRPPADEIEDDARANPWVQSTDVYETIAGLIRAIPIWVFHGDADTAVSVSESRQLVAALKSAGANVLYTEYANTDHAPTSVNAWADKDLMPWLLAQRRKAGPH